MEATYTIADKEYLLIDLLVTRRNAKATQYAYDKYVAIGKEIKQISEGGWFKARYIVCSVYIPLESYKDFTKSIKDNVVGENKDLNLTTTMKLMIGFGAAVVAALVIMAYFSKKFAIPEPEQKPNIFKRIKLWFQNKFSKNTKPVTTAEPEPTKTETKGIFTTENEQPNV